MTDPVREMISNAVKRHFADDIQVTPEMALEGSRFLADKFEYAIAGDWLTMEHAAEIFRRMMLARHD